MSSKAASSSTRQSRSAVPGDRRRGRSRSPSHYLKKSGKSIKGFLSGSKSEKNLKTSSRGSVQSSKSFTARPSASAAAASAAAIGVSSPTSVVTTQETIKEGKTTPTQPVVPDDPPQVEEKEKVQTKEASDTTEVSASNEVTESKKEEASNMKDEASETKEEEAPATKEEAPEMKDETPEARTAESTTDASANAIKDEDASSKAASLSFDESDTEFKVVVESPSTEEPTKHDNEQVNDAKEKENLSSEESEAANPQDETKSHPKPLPINEMDSKTTMQLLLMEPKTRRFELLQLEFNPARAVVADILSQVAVTATEDPLRTQEYRGICSANGTEVDSEKLLSDYFIGKGDDDSGFALAVPNGLTGKDVALLARPILLDPKIKMMFQSVSARDVENMDTAAPVNKNKLRKKEAIPDEKKNDDGTKKDQTKDKEVRKGQMEKEKKKQEMDKEKNTGEVKKKTTKKIDKKEEKNTGPMNQNSVNPQKMAKEEEKTTKDSTVKDTKKVTVKPPSGVDKKKEQSGEEDIANVIAGGKPEQKSRDILGSKTEDSMGEVKAAAGEDTATKSFASSSLPTLVVFIALLASVIPFMTILHQTVVSPLSPGDTLEIGQWRSKCGLLAVLPEALSVCHDMRLELGDDGVLTLYDTGNMWNEEHSIAWTMKATRKLDDFILRLDDDGHITIGNREVKLDKKGSQVEDLSPWPFTSPKIGRKKKRWLD